MSYTEFAFTDVRLCRRDGEVLGPDPAADGEAPGRSGGPGRMPFATIGRDDAARGLILRFTVTNTGEASGAAVPMLFLRRRSGSVIPRVRELKAFTRTDLRPGESRQAELTLDEEALSVLGLDMKESVEPGVVDLLLWEGTGFRWHGAVGLR